MANPRHAAPRRSYQPAPPPSGEPDVGIDVGEGEEFAAAGDGFDASQRGAMRRRPGLDDEDDEVTEPTGWTIPGWEDD